MNTNRKVEGEDVPFIVVRQPIHCVESKLITIENTCFKRWQLKY
jgi:hypothetical protein